jgi:hypothetical protein
MMNTNTHSEIELNSILHKCVEDTWSTNPETGLIDVIGDVLLPSELTQIPVRFGHVSGSFYCSNTGITSLEGAPQRVGGDVYCHNTKITSLVGAPHSVGGDFYCHNIGITSLDGAPQNIGGTFVCNYTKITSLAGAPQSVGKNFYCYGTNITSLDGAPQSIGGTFHCYNTPLVDHLLAFFRTSGIKSVSTGNEHVDTILNKYLNGDRDMLLCQDELIDAGFGDRARLTR